MQICFTLTIQYPDEVDCVAAKNSLTPPTPANC